MFWATLQREFVVWRKTHVTRVERLLNIAANGKTASVPLCQQEPGGEQRQVTPEQAAVMLFALANIDENCHEDWAAMPLPVLYAKSLLFLEATT